MQYAPVAMARTMVSRGISVSGKSDGKPVKMREFITDITGSVDFACSTLEINPGRDVIFPWLATIANRYEEYAFRNLRFLYEPRCSTQTAGTVMLAIDYDAKDITPSTKQIVLSYSGAVSSAAWKDAQCICDPRILALRGHLFTRAGAAPSSTDIKTYDLGNLLICTMGFAGATACGELYVEYEVDLRIPQTTESIQLGYFTNSAGMDATHLVGTITNAGVTGNIPGNYLLDYTATDTRTLTFNQNWKGEVVLTLVGTGFVAGGLVNTGTSTGGAVANGEVANNAQTLMCSRYNVTALRGQTLVLAVTATTVTSVTWELLPKETR